MVVGAHDEIWDSSENQPQKPSVKTEKRTSQKNTRNVHPYALCSEKQANLNNMWFRDVLRNGKSCIEKCRNH